MDKCKFAQTKKPGIINRNVQKRWPCWLLTRQLIEIVRSSSFISRIINWSPNRITCKTPKLHPILGRKSRARDETLQSDKRTALQLLFNISSQNGKSLIIPSCNSNANVIALYAYLHAKGVNTKTEG